MLRSAMFGAGLLLAGMAWANEPVLVTDEQMQLPASEFNAMLVYGLPAQRLAMLRENRANFDGMLREYVLLRQMEQEAIQLGLDQKPDFLARQKMYRLTELASALTEHKLSSLPLPDFTPAAKERFKAMGDSLVAPDQVHAQHILIAINDTRSQTQALQLANQVREQLVANPKQFESLVTKHSDDPGAALNKGDLGFFTPGRMVKPFSDAAFALKPGDISQPVLSEFGYHIIHVLERKAGKKLKFVDVKNRLINEDKQAFYERERAKLLESYQQRDSLNYDNQAIDAYYRDFADKK